MAAIAKVEKNRHSSARLGSVETEGNVLLSRTERPGSPDMALVANFADNRNRWQMWACFDLRHAPLADDVARERLDAPKVRVFLDRKYRDFQDKLSILMPELQPLASPSSLSEVDVFCQVSELFHWAESGPDTSVSNREQQARGQVQRDGTYTIREAHGHWQCCLTDGGLDTSKQPRRRRRCSALHRDAALWR